MYYGFLHFPKREREWNTFISTFSLQITTYVLHDWAETIQHGGMRKWTKLWHLSLYKKHPIQGARTGQYNTKTLQHSFHKFRSDTVFLAHRTYIYNLGIYPFLIPKQEGCSKKPQNIQRTSFIRLIPEDTCSANVSDILPILISLATSLWTIYNLSKQRAQLWTLK